MNQQVGGPGSGAQGPLKISEDIGDGLETGQQSVLLLVPEPSLYLLIGRDDCRVVAVAEMATDLAVRGAGMLARQVHGQHPGIGQGTGATVRFQCLRIDLEELAYRALDVTQADGCAV